MKVLFVWPEYRISGYKNTGISILSSILKKKGHSVRLFDTSTYDIPITGRDDNIRVGEDLMLFPKTDMPEVSKIKASKHYIQAIKEVVQEYRPHLVAFSTTTLPYILVEKIVNCLKSMPDISFGIGGIHTLSCTDDVMASGLFDYICLGEGENAIIPIMEHVDGKRDDNDIPNVILKTKDGYVENKVSPLIVDIDNLPFYDWDIFEAYHFWRPYQGTAYRMGDYITSRGCPYNCSFCFYNTLHSFYDKQNKIRYLTKERCVDEIKYLSDRYDVGFYKFHDSDLLLRSEEKFGALMELYAKKIRLPFVGNTNAYSVTKDKVKMLKEANCKSMSIGVESGSEKIRSNVLNKKGSNEKIIEAVDMFKKEGIRICTFNMIGIPEETEEDIRETIKLNRVASPDLADYAYFYPFKGTVLGNLCYGKGYVRQHSLELVSIRTKCVLKYPQIKTEILEGLHKTFPLYMNLPEWIDPLVSIAERDDEIGCEVYAKLKEIVLKKVNSNLVLD